VCDKWTMTNRATSAQLDRLSAVEAVVAELGDWASGAGSIYRQLARGLTTGIERGALPGGFRLPSERALAEVLSVSRGTAVAAYDVLVADGMVERRRGSGSYVADALAPSLPADREGSSLVHRLVDESDAAHEGIIDLSLSVLHDVGDLGDVSLRPRDLATVVPDTGYSPWGLPLLREQLAAHAARWGMAATADHVVVTTGAQQAISASAACWVKPGDTVVVDDPTYPGAIAAFRQAGATLVGVGLDRNGVIVGELERALSRKPALVYLQSSVHSPTGTVLAERRRREIARLLRDARVPLVEDMALADLSWGMAPPPIASFAAGATVAVVGSLSKVFWGGLRVGFVIAPDPVALRFARVKAIQDLGSSVVSQALAQRLLVVADREDFVDRRRRELRRRYEVLAGALVAAVPDWSWSEPRGGLSLWVQLPGADAESFARTALRHGVAVAGPAALSATGRHGDHLRLSFSASPDVLRAGVERLAVAWADHARGAGSPSSRPTAT
jgi:DNA-binding transcriptional MocR family regulator